MQLDTDIATSTITRNAVASSVRTLKTHGSARKHQLVPIAGLMQYFFPTVVALGIHRRDVYVVIMKNEYTHVHVIDSILDFYHSELLL